MNDKLEFSMLKSHPMILQSEIAECCLASIASFHGHKLDMAAMRKSFSANLKGMNFQQLIELGDSLHLASRPLQCPIGEIHKLATPCILHWDVNHFVVLTKINGKGRKARFSINGPAIGKRALNIDEFSKHLQEFF